MNRGQPMNLPYKQKACHAGTPGTRPGIIDTQQQYKKSSARVPGLHH